MDKYKKLPPDATKVFEGKLHSIWQYPQKLYDGSTATFEKIERADTATVIAILPDHRILLVEDEQPHRETVLTVAGGRVEKGEEPIEAAKRELLEETGYTAPEFIPWFSYEPSSKWLWTVYVFIARGASQLTEPSFDAGEKIKTIFYTFEDFLQLGRTTQLQDTMLRIYLLEALLDSTKRAELEKLFYGA